MPYIVGCAAQARNGKDTVVAHLLKRLNSYEKLGQWKKGSFGIAVKKIFAENFEVSLEFIEEWKVKTEIPPGFDRPLRDGLTMIGSEWRFQRKTIWIDKLLTNNEGNLLIADNRYINETEAIHARGGMTILMWRPGYENNKQSDSEQELMPFVRSLKDTPTGPIDIKDIPFDMWLRNEGTLEDLYNKLDEVFVPYIIKKFS